MRLGLQQKKQPVRLMQNLMINQIPLWHHEIWNKTQNVKLQWAMLVKYQRKHHKNSFHKEYNMKRLKSLIMIRMRLILMIGLIKKNLFSFPNTRLNKVTQSLTAISTWKTVHGLNLIWQRWLHACFYLLVSKFHLCVYFRIFMFQRWRQSKLLLLWRVYSRPKSRWQFVEMALVAKHQWLKTSCSTKFFSLHKAPIQTT